MHSPGHRANILRPQFGRLGIGVLDGGTHWPDGHAGLQEIDSPRRSACGCSPSRGRHHRLRQSRFRGGTGVGLALAGGVHTPSTGDLRLKAAEELTPTDPKEAAESVGLVYVSGRRARHPARARKGEGFVYFRPNGDPLKDEAPLDRIRPLAIPPADTDVRISPARPNSHLRSHGARRPCGRKQYRYHATFPRTSGRREVRTSDGLRRALQTSAARCADI